MELDEKERLKYSIGGLLYAPGMNRKVPQKVKNGSFPFLTSLAFCLEDTIQDDCLEEAEQILKEVLGELAEIEEKKRPLVFVRIRTPEHMRHIIDLYKDYSDIISGYLLPKFDLSNMNDYISCIKKVNAGKDKITYIMPILETRMIADVATRIGTLTKIKESLDTIKDYV
ncbi:MAG: HpcH/HpaI aldolase/citrate lyase family protein, partial [Butyrivibrio sp.]|nr:HpcH/HpaI aldolase/citrate lyase family protein [Butyrivibrio sp.]